MITTASALVELADDWDALSRGVPFRSFAWLETWWRHYGNVGDGSGERAQPRLAVVAVRQADGLLVGIAPWYRDETLARGRVLKFLGSGETYSDYLSLFAQPGREEAVAHAVANWLIGPFAGQWDALEFTGVDAADLVVRSLIAQLENRGVRVFRRPDLNCWRIDLPPTWDEYVGRLSKSHRKQIRRAERRLLETGRVAAIAATAAPQLDEAIERLIDLHQRRHYHRGHTGAFSSPAFANFHRNVIPRLVRAGQARLNVLNFDGQLVAVEYLLMGRDVVYAYQSGIDPNWLRVEPGRLSTMIAIRQAIDAGFRAFDFLRGDEPYKAHWRATPRVTLRARAVPPSRSARVRNTFWLAQDSTRQWLKARWRSSVKP